MSSRNADSRQSQGLQTSPSMTPSGTQPGQSHRQHTALIVALIVVVIAAMIGLSWALVSGQWADETNMKSTASSSLSSRAETQNRHRQKSGESRESGKSRLSQGQTGQTDTSAQSDTLAQSNDSDRSSASDKSDQSDQSDAKTNPAPLPTVNKSTGDRFAATYRACGPGKPFSEDNTSQESLILEKGNRTLTLLAGAKSDFKLYGCVVKQLGIPADQAQKMAAKKVSQGLQTFDFDGLTAQWSYSPSGLDLYVTQKQ